ncbi:MAG: DUF1043 family protein [Kangiellaceae bacterium]|nr:DUF1043 family protein [Kangiellaceae bacterium]
MTTFLFILGLIGAAVGGFFFGRWHGMSHRSKEIAEQLEHKEQELDQLKSNVDEHFEHTAELFSNLTEEYKALYKHLAAGASKLSKKSFQLSITSTANNSELIEQQIEETKGQTVETEVIEEQPEATNENHEEQQVDHNDDDVKQPLDYAPENSEIDKLENSSEHNLSENSNKQQE